VTVAGVEEVVPVWHPLTAQVLAVGDAELKDANVGSAMTAGTCSWAPNITRAKVIMVNHRSIGLRFVFNLIPPYTNLFFQTPKTR